MVAVRRAQEVAVATSSTSWSGGQSCGPAWTDPTNRIPATSALQITLDRFMRYSSMTCSGRRKAPVVGPAARHSNKRSSCLCKHYCHWKTPGDTKRTIRYLHFLECGTKSPHSNAPKHQARVILPCRRMTANHIFGPPSENVTSVNSGWISHRTGWMDSTTH